MPERIQIGDISITVTFKDIKNLHLSVHPPTGRVTVSAPLRMSQDAVRAYAVSKLPWIRQQQRKLRGQERETVREYLDGESHYVWGKRYLLKVVEADQPPSVELKHNRIILHVRPGADRAKREEIMEDWYRQQVKRLAASLIAEWESKIGVRVTKFYVQHMKTRWGSCNHKAGTIRLNTDLAKKLRACLDYIVVHELVHILEPTHNERFIALMDRHLPAWRSHRDVLNRLPVRHEEWGY